MKDQIDLGNVALEVTYGAGKPTYIPIESYGMGLYRNWVPHDHRTDNKASIHVGAEGKEGGTETEVISTIEELLGHYELASFSFSTTLALTITPQKTAQTPTQQPPCSEQDFNFSQGSGNYSATDLSAIVQTAVGEASNYYAVGEVSTLVATIFNRLNTNQIYVNQGVGYTPYKGGTSVMGVLGGYQAHWDRSQRPDHLRSGEGNLADARINGVLPTGSYVCDQLMAARTAARRLGATTDADALFSQFPFTYNMGIGPALPKDAFGVYRIGNTRFFNRPF